MFLHVDHKGRHLRGPTCISRIEKEDKSIPTEISAYQPRSVSAYSRAGKGGKWVARQACTIYLGT